jgi:hypothetical protein
MCQSTGRSEAGSTFSMPSSSTMKNRLVRLKRTSTHEHSGRLLLVDREVRIAYRQRRKKEPHDRGAGVLYFRSRRFQVARRLVLHERGREARQFG